MRRWYLRCLLYSSFRKASTRSSAEGSPFTGLKSEFCVREHWWLWKMQLWNWKTVFVCKQYPSTGSPCCPTRNSPELYLWFILICPWLDTHSNHPILPYLSQCSSRKFFSLRLQMGETVGIFFIIDHKYKAFTSHPNMFWHVFAFRGLFRGDDERWLMDLRRYCFWECYASPHWQKW